LKHPCGTDCDHFYMLTGQWEVFDGGHWSLGQQGRLESLLRSVSTVQVVAVYARVEFCSQTEVQCSARDRIQEWWRARIVRHEQPPNHRQGPYTLERRHGERSVAGTSGSVRCSEGSLSAPRNLFVDGFRSLQHIQEAIKPFVATRKLSGRPVAINRWRRDGHNGSPYSRINKSFDC